jgi:shikimate dehydrogenase
MSERFVLIGHPVAHSLSPVIHGAAYRALGRSARYELIDAPDEAAVAAVVDELRAGNIRGANVTVPWKRVALALADRVDESARAVGAANVLHRADDGAVVAYNTDALGLAEELTQLMAEARLEPGSTTACVLGNGGAALGAVVACQLAGVKRVHVVARRFRADVPRAQWPEAASFERLGAELVAWPHTGDDSWEKLSRDAQLFVQATSAGMHGAEAGAAVADLVPFAERARASVAAYDLVYKPEQTPFLEAARKAGQITRGGLGMLVRQAAFAIEIWWSALPPTEPMFEAVRGVIGR